MARERKFDSSGSTKKTPSGKLMVTIVEALLPALFDAVTAVLADLLPNGPNLPMLDEKIACRLLEAKLAGWNPSA